QPERTKAAVCRGKCSSRPGERTIRRRVATASKMPAAQRTVSKTEPLGICSWWFLRVLVETRERNLYLSPMRVGAWKLRSCARWHSIPGVSLKMLPSSVANLKAARTLDFNSLHAQREACESFMKSQAGEGWQLVKTAYDDGGLSGGSMERPGLQRLLSDIRDKLIDIVLVYKVDRLTRSLADFAKMVEVFDSNGVSFVAVTQQFNTTSSMGRLTLNVLLSFAQFEREVTGERIRDKITASKKKGLWMGGTVPLGYDWCERRLV